MGSPARLGGRFISLELAEHERRRRCQRGEYQEIVFTPLSPCRVGHGQDAHLLGLDPEGNHQRLRRPQLLEQAFVRVWEVVQVARLAGAERPHDRITRCDREGVVADFQRIA